MLGAPALQQWPRASCPCPAPALLSAEEETNNGDTISLFCGEQGCHGRSHCSSGTQGITRPRGAAGDTESAGKMSFPDDVYSQPNTQADCFTNFNRL